MAIQALAVCDQIDQRIHSATLRERMPDVEIVFGCGDLPARYLEFIVDALDKPLYYVLGNHAEELTRKGDWGKRHRTRPLGCIDIGGKVIRDPATGLILAGLPGSPKYNNEPEQYTEWQMYWKIARMMPTLWYNRKRYGRAVDILVTHSPPRDINDREDPAHRGFKVMRKFLEWFQPSYHLHGHIHLYDRSLSPVTAHAQTTVINVYPYQVLDLAVPALAETQSRAAPPTDDASPRGIGLSHSPLAVPGGGLIGATAEPEPEPRREPPLRLDTDVIDRDARHAHPTRQRATG